MLQIFGRSTLKAKRILNIGFVTQDAAMGAQLKDFVAKRDGVDLKLIESAKVTATAAPKGVAIFVYDLDASTDQSLREFERFMIQRPPQIPVVVLSPAITDELVRWFLRLKVSDWIKTPLSPGELIATCGRILTQAPDGKPDVKCLTFIGARGGAGTTTIAIHAALVLSGKVVAAPTTCLIDLDLVSGSCADYLDLKPNWQIDELIPDPSRLDRHMLDMMITSHASGIAVLSTQRKFCERQAFNEEVITRTLDLASQKYANVVIDLPRQAEAWTDSVLIGSNQVFVVTDFSIPGLKAARRMSNDIIERTGGEVLPKVIVNKYQRTLFGTSISNSDVKEILREAFAGYVHADTKLMREAIDRGIPTTAIKRKNIIIKDVAKIIGAS